MDRKNILDVARLVKKICTIFIRVKHQQSVSIRPYIDGREEPKIDEKL